MENYINKIIKDIRSSLLSFMFVKTYISNPIEILDRYYPYHINMYGEFPNSLFNRKFIEFANNDINVFIELLESNNTEIQITNLHEKLFGICNKLIQTLENSSVNNSSTFTDILQFLENTSNDNKQKMQNNIEIVKSMKNEEKEHLVRFLESKFKCIIEPVFFCKFIRIRFRIFN